MSTGGLADRQQSGEGRYVDGGADGYTSQGFKLSRPCCECEIRKGLISMCRYVGLVVLSAHLSVSLQAERDRPANRLADTLIDR
eukprot:12128205-Alexandrium_andersonii.AAC.1